MRAIDGRRFRTALGRFATGIVVVSTRCDGVLHAMTANAFMSGSLEPPLVLVSIGRRARMHGFLDRGDAFGVAVLTHTQERHSRHFAGQGLEGFDPRFEDLDGIPVLGSAAARIAARIVHRYACGDHSLFVGQVVALELGDEEIGPLLFYAGKYARLEPARAFRPGARPDELPFFY
jgi:flavin reductase (DIM6/NTAB) family NADH-FMN oxidoreductase RutF